MSVGIEFCSESRVPIEAPDLTLFRALRLRPDLPRLLLRTFYAILIYDLPKGNMKSCISRLRSVATCYEILLSFQIVSL